MIAFPHAPPRVENPELYWTDPPPERSARCEWWVKRMKDGWVGNKRIQSMGYSTAAEYFGVYYWEYLNVLFFIVHPPSTTSAMPVATVSMKRCSKTDSRGVRCEMIGEHEACAAPAALRRFMGLPVL